MKERNDDKAILILSDMEGVSGIVDTRLITPKDLFWREYGRHLLTEDVNAIAATLYASGIKKIYLSESHDFGKNTVVEYLLPFITVLPPHSAQSSMHGRSFWEEFYAGRNVQGAIMVGCHGMAGTNGFLPHSWDGNVFEYIKANNEQFGEIGLTAGLLGYYSIPLIGVTGDEVAIKEAEKIVPDIIGVTVKRQEKDDWLSILPPDEAQQLIREKTSECLERLSTIKPFRFKEPINLSFKVKEKGYLVNIARDKRLRIDTQVVDILASSYLDAYDIFWDCYVKMIMG